MYSEKKEIAREKAIEWQQDFNNWNYSYLELAQHSNQFYKIAKRYGLIKEFRENGII